MHRRPLLNLLAAYLQRFPEERATVERIQDLVAGHPDCFERSCRPGHITASAWVTTRDLSHVLLVHHRKLDKWLQPGGHVDGQGDIPAAALREAQEESGLANLRLAGRRGEAIPLDVDIHHIPPFCRADGSLIEDAHDHHDIRFLVVAEAVATPQISVESHDVRWFTPAELLAVTEEESVLRLWRKASSLD